MKMKVYVDDHDDNSNDYVDYLQTVMVVTPAKSEHTATSVTYVLNRRTRYEKLKCMHAKLQCSCLLKPS